LKFLVDMPLPPGLAAWLRQEGHDAVHAGQIGLHRAPDTGIIAHAAAENRIIVTADHDFPKLLMAMEAASASAILFRGGDFNDAAAFEYMRRALAVIDADEPRRFLMTADRHRVRRRWLG
jgi:predicted nuclease of predicted toxin-antitoxin system